MFVNETGGSAGVVKVYVPDSRPVGVKLSVSAPVVPVTVRVSLVDALPPLTVIDAGRSARSCC